MLIYCLIIGNISKTSNVKIKIIFILTIRGLKQQRYKVLEMDLQGNLYFHKNALLCKYEIIERLTSGKYHLEEQSPIGNLLTSLRKTIENSEHLTYNA